MFLFNDWPFPHMCTCKDCSLFPINSWLSFQRLCRLFWDNSLAHKTAACMAYEECTVCVQYMNRSTRCRRTRFML